MDDARFEVEPIEAPPLAAAGVGGYGSTIVARPGTDEVIFSRHVGAPRVRWLRYRLGSRTFREGTGLAGDLRDAVFRGAEGWLLGTYGLCRVSLEPLAVLDVVTKGLGKYKHRLFELNETLLLVTAAEGQTAALVGTDPPEVVKSVRVDSPDFVVREPASAVLCAFHAGVARDLDVATSRLVGRRTLPRATTPLAVGDTIIALGGPQAPFGRVIETDHVVADTLVDMLGPVGRLARRVLGVPPAESPLGLTIRPQQFLEIDGRDLSVRRAVDGAAGLRTLIGVDGKGRLIATADWGLALVDLDRLEVLQRLENEAVTGPACWVQAAQTVVVLRHYLVDPPPGGFDPVPEKLVLVRW